MLHIEKKILQKMFHGIYSYGISFHGESLKGFYLRKVLLNKTDKEMLEDQMSRGKQQYKDIAHSYDHMSVELSC